MERDPLPATPPSAPTPARLGRAQQLAHHAGTLVGKVRSLTGISAVAAALVWLALFEPFVFAAPWQVGLAAAVALLLLAPVVVMALFYAGLRSLVTLPDRLRAMASEGREQAGALLDSVSGDESRPRRRLWRFFRSVLELRGLVLDSKALLIGYAAVVRLRVFNPVFIGVLFFSFVACLGLVVAGLVALLALAL